MGDIKMTFKILFGGNEGESQLGKSKRRREYNIKIVLGDM
jgi:hypothetical protein